MLFETMPQVIHTSNTLLPTLPQQSTGLSFDTHYRSSPLPSIRSYPNSITNGYLYRTDTTSSSTPHHYCPSCQQHPKTPAHFLACTHHDWVQIWKELHNQLHQHQIKNNISNIFYDIMAYGLYTGHQALHTIQLHHLLQDIQDMQEQQQQIGWTTIYYGWISPTWAQVLQNHHPQVNAVLYYDKCITLIWKAVLQVWTVWNKHLHPGTYQQEDWHLLEAAIQLNFEEAQSDPHLQPFISNLDPETILAWPTHQVRQWVTNSKHHIQAHRKAQQLCAKLQTKDIWQFFPPKSHTRVPTAEDKNLLHPP